MFFRDENLKKEKNVKRLYQSLAKEQPLVPTDRVEFSCIRARFREIVATRT